MAGVVARPGNPTAETIYISGATVSDLNLLNVEIRPTVIFQKCSFKDVFGRSKPRLIMT